MIMLWGVKFKMKEYKIEKLQKLLDYLNNLKKKEEKKEIDRNKREIIGFKYVIIGEINKMSEKFKKSCEKILDLSNKLEETEIGKELLLDYIKITEENIDYWKKELLKDDGYRCIHKIESLIWAFESIKKGSETMFNIIIKKYNQRND
jgi:hypothetical protein